MSNISFRRGAVASFVVAFALAALPAAAQIQVKACFETVHKRCCEAATGVELTVTCSDKDVSWICVGSITQDKLITTTQASASGLRFSTNFGTETCKYKKPLCGHFVGTCDYGDEVAATCQIKAATGTDCISPVFLDAAGELADVTAAACHTN